ncbi:MAG: hypothetical protein ACAH82_07615, partial [Solirubrobacteraceae bacterium]
LVSACPWSERPLSAAGEARQIDVVDLHELLAESLGLASGAVTSDATRDDGVTSPGGEAE